MSPVIAATAIPTGPVRTVKAVASVPMAGVAAAAPVVTTAKAADTVDIAPMTAPIPPTSLPPISSNGPMAAAKAATLTIVSWVAGERLANQSTAC